MSSTGSIPGRKSGHRANYTLERGMWHATCRTCGHRVSDPDRRRAAALYREHIKETNVSPARLGERLDLPRVPPDPDADADPLVV